MVRAAPHRPSRGVFLTVASVLAATLLSAAPSTAASVDLAVSEDVVRVARGGTHVVSATIANLGSRPVRIGGITSGVTPEFAQADLFDAFAAWAPDSLGPGESWEGPVLTLTLAADAPAGIRVFDLVLNGGDTPYDTAEIGRTYFAVDDSTTSLGVAPPVAAGPALRASPNPFSARLGIDFVAGEAGRYDVAVYDVAGRRVAALFEGDLPAGAHHVTWNGRPDHGASTNGVFFVRVAHRDRVLKTRVLELR